MRIGSMHRPFETRGNHSFRRGAENTKREACRRAGCGFAGEGERMKILESFSVSLAWMLAGGAFSMMCHGNIDAALVTLLFAIFITLWSPGWPGNK
jgi:hypothetical protein